jgi:Protein of unknown function (DUF1810)
MTRCSGQKYGMLIAGFWSRVGLTRCGLARGRTGLHLLEVFPERLRRDAGLRIDHLLLGPRLAKRLISAGVNRDVRGREHASDHAPAWIELAKPTEADPFNLERFVTAQAPVFETVLAELRAGRKQSHWMWFIFPQLADLGRSSTARLYGIGSVNEARAYLDHAALGPRLDLCTRIVLAIESPSVHRRTTRTIRFVRLSTAGAAGNPTNKRWR